jgi:cobalt-zinc-cadmium efflux system protein
VVDRTASRRSLRVAFALTVAYGAAQVVGGIVLHSVALLADAVHNIADGAAIAIALAAAGLAARGASGRRTFGYARVEVLAALVNGITLVALAGVIAFEAVDRLANPERVRGAGVIVFGIAGLAANGYATLGMLRARGRRDDMNLEAALRHTASDAAGSLGVLVAGVLVVAFAWQRADPVIALLVAALTLAGSVRLIREPLVVLLEQAPSRVDPEEVGVALCRVPGVRNVHDLHVWTITSGFVALAVHVVAAQGVDHDELLHRLQDEIGRRFGIEHTTIQIDEDHATLLQIHRPGCPEAPKPRRTPLPHGAHLHDHEEP